MSKAKRDKNTMRSVSKVIAKTRKLLNRTYTHAPYESPCFMLPAPVFQLKEVPFH